MGFATSDRGPVHVSEVRVTMLAFTMFFVCEARVTMFGVTMCARRESRSPPGHVCEARVTMLARSRLRLSEDSNQVVSGSGQVLAALRRLLIESFRYQNYS